MAGGGVFGKAGGIVPTITTGVGFITTGCRVSTSMWILSGECFIEIMSGTGTGGIMNGFLTGTFGRTGRVGGAIVTGRGKERTGASNAISRGRSSRDRN